jgi:hypothetical protein
LAQLVKRLAFLAAASAALFPARAQAQEYTGSVGVFAGYRFGSRAGFEWGVELLATRILTDNQLCGAPPRWGVGPMFQFAMAGLRDPHFTLAAHAGKEIDRAAWALTGELGATYRSGSEPGVGIHVGMTPELVYFNLAARAQLFLNDYAISAGARSFPTYGVPKGCIVGRPLRTDDGIAPIGNLSTPGRVATCGRSATDQELAGYGWERDAAFECASIPAFLDLAEALLLHGAPGALIEQALNAAADEILHAELCARLASRFLGRPVRPAVPELRQRAQLGGLPGIRRLATESWLDGCLAEGAAAKQALRAAELARDGRARAAQARIAGDESRHAELGWNVLAWAFDRAGREAIGAVEALRHPELGAADRRTMPERLERHGRLSAVEIDSIIERHAAESRHRLDALILAARG